MNGLDTCAKMHYHRVPSLHVTSVGFALCKIRSSGLLVLLVMSKILNINWESLPGAFEKRRVLKLRPNEGGVYECNIENCLREGFKTSRGLRKHIVVRHPWFMYHDKQPDIREQVTEARKKSKKRYLN